MLRADGPSSQAAIARRLGVSPATVSSVVRDLRADGLLDLRRLNGRESLVALAEPRTAVVAAEVNAQGVRVVLFDFTRHARHERSVDPTSADGPRMLVELIRTVTDSAGLELADLAGVGVAIQSPVEPVTGTIASWAHHHLAGWLELPIAQAMQDELGVTVIVENDANLAALAEWTWGAGRGVEDFLYLMCASGVGGGFILNGRIYRGNAGLAGEIGHLVIEPSGPVCFCGSRGCVTTYVSERSILLALEESGARAQSLAEVIAAARAGDPATRAVLWEVGRHLGRAVFSATKIIAPSVIAVGGALSQAGPLIFDSLNSSVEVNSLRAVASTSRVRPAELDADATVLGAVAVVLEGIGRGISELPDWMRHSRRDQPLTNPGSRS